MTRLAVSVIAQLALLAGFIHFPASAAFPDRPIQIVVPGAAGSNSDSLVRMLVNKLSANLGQPIIVDNRPGAGGTVAREYAAKAKPDGYTLLYGSVGTFCVSPKAGTGVAYDVLREFDAVTLVGRAPATLLVHPEVPARTLPEFVAYARANPGRIAYGSPGEGSAHHVVAMLLEQVADIRLVHVPYKNGPQEMVDLVGGQIQAAMEFAPVAAPLVRAGKLRALVVAGDGEIPLLPGVPSAKDAGMPGFNLPGWAGFVAPTGTPPEIIARLGAELATALKQPDVTQAQVQVGVEIAASPPNEFAAYLRSECGRWSSIIERGRK